MDTDSFVLNIFTEDFFEYINNDIERWFDTSNYDKNDNKRLQTFGRVTTYPYGTNAFKVCESEMLIVKDLFLDKLQWNSVITININDQLWWIR